MDEIRLPQHIVNRIERRWARFEQTLGYWRHPERAPLSPAARNHDPLRSRKFGGCWRDACGRRLCSLGNSDRARTVCGYRNFPQEVGLPDVFHF